jgi:hypothetical protein
MNLPEKPPAKGIHSQVDLFELKDGEYRLTVRDRDFQEFLERDLGYQLIPMSRKDQNLYGINFLTVRANEILAVDGVSEEYKELIRSNHVDATWMDFSALTGGYGAAHCTTQVLYRETPLPLSLSPIFERWLRQGKPQSRFHNLCIFPRQSGRVPPL